MHLPVRLPTSPIDVEPYAAAVVNLPPTYKGPQMIKLLTAAAIAITLTASLPARAQDTVDAAACKASWSKLGAKKLGYVNESKEQMDMMTNGGRTTAAADPMTDKEYMDACMAKAFDPKK
jgi:hypothetical protein